MTTPSEPERLKEAERQLAEAREALGSALSKMDLARAVLNSNEDRANNVHMAGILQEEIQKASRALEGLSFGCKGCEAHHARIAALEREVAKTFTAAMELRSMAVANGQERDEARAALRDLVYQSEWFESCAEEGSEAWNAYAEARRVLGEGKP